jgi:hypothetical protein
MGVSVRVAGGVLLSVLALLPTPAGAAPIIIEQTIADPLTAGPLVGTFTFDNDVALFHFTLDAGLYDFSASTTSYAAGGFDPFLALYEADGPMVTYDDGGVPVFARNDNASDLGDPTPVVDPDALLAFQLTLAVQTQFTLALFQGGNEAIESQIAFTWDDDAFRCATDFADPCTTGSFLDFYTGEIRSNTFALDLVVTSADTSQVPEPSTLSLMAVGMAGAALFRRRRLRRHSNPL